MGGRGTFASGNTVPYTYNTVGKIDGVKILKPMDSSKSLKLPEEAHSSSSYVLLDKDNVFTNIVNIIQIMKLYWKLDIITKNLWEKVMFCTSTFIKSPALIITMIQQQKSAN